MLRKLQRIKNCLIRSKIIRLVVTTLTLKVELSKNRLMLLMLNISEKME